MIQFAFKQRVMMCLILILFCVASVFADVGWARHKKVYAVPVPGKMVIDGKLNDWDLSGQIHQYVISETADMQGTRFAMMYDTDAVYLSAIVRDTSPMMNRHDPNVDPDKAWDADVCQLFMSLDPALGYPINKASFNRDESDKMCTLMLWHYTDRKEANLVALKAMTFSKPLRPDLSTTGVIPREHFQAKYLMADDKRGYTFEYRVPWATLGITNPPKAGDQLATTVCFFWGTPDGFKTAGGSAWCYDVMSGPGFPYQSSACWGKLILSPKGKLPKEMVEEGLPPEKPMPLTFKYNLPEDSEATVVLFDEKGKAVRTLVASGARRTGENVERWDGLDNSGKPLAPGTYNWKGLYHLPIKTKFVLSAHNSGQPPYKKDDGTGGWGGDHGNPTSVCAAGDSMLLTWSMSESGWGIIKTDLNGKKLWGLTHNAEDIASDGKLLFVAGDNGHNGAESVKPFDLKDGRKLNWGNGKPALDPPAGGDEKTNVATAIAYYNNKLYVSWKMRDAIAIYDIKSGDLQETIAVEQPEKITVRNDGVILVVSKGKIVQASKQNTKVLVAAGADYIDTPRGITTDAAGNLYVANAGKLQNVSVYDKDGKYLKSIGKKGGRPKIGRYESDGILEPGGIAISKDGNLWVSEILDAPKRHSVWNTQTGALVKEFFGASSYFGWAYMDPKHPDELYCHNVLWKVNLNTGSCVPHSTIWRPTAENMIEQPNPGGYAGHFRVMTAKNGKQYGFGMIDYSPMLFIRDGDIFKPLTGSIRVAYGAYGSGMLYPVMKGIYDKTKAGAFLWQDKNNDQTVQEDELTVSEAGRGETSFNWVDSDLNIWNDAGYIFKPVEIKEDGRPVYDFTKKEMIPFKGGNSNGTSLIYDETDGGVYTLADGEPGFARWTKDGKMVWAYGPNISWHSALSLPMITPGKLWGLTMPLGIAGDFTGVSCYFGPYHLFTKDGLYVAMIMRDGRSGGLGADITASEVVTGQLVKPDGMNRYFLIAGDQDGRVTEIMGLDTVKRLQGGTYIHTEEAAKTASDALKEYQRLLSQSQRLDIVKGLQALKIGKAVSKSVDAARGFTVRAAYDAKNLYLSYDVRTPNPLVNEIGDPQRIFKGGNCIDIQIGTDYKADVKRTKPVFGDVRVLVTKQGGKTTAVVFKPKVKDFARKPVVLTSPTGTEPFDAIETTDRVELNLTKTADGFNAVVTIPQDLIGLNLQSGDTVKMDVGYLFGNATGSQVALRSYWMNNGFSANVTSDIPNESRLVPNEWGIATVE